MKTSIGAECCVSGFADEAMSIVGSKGHIELEIFSDNPLLLSNEGGVQEVSIPNPPHVQQPFIQSIVDDLNEVAQCPSRIESAVRATWVADQILGKYRQEHGY